MPKDDQDGSVEGTLPVDLSTLPRPRGMTIYGSTKLERNSKSVNISSSASITYTPPEGEPYKVSMDKFEQLQWEAQKRCWDNAESRQNAVLARIRGEDARIFEKDFEVDYMLPENGAVASSIEFEKSIDIDDEPF